jgi:hypothetical protein
MVAQKPFDPLKVRSNQPKYICIYIYIYIYMYIHIYAFLLSCVLSLRPYFTPSLPFLPQPFSFAEALPKCRSQHHGNTLSHNWSLSLPASHPVWGGGVEREREREREGGRCKRRRRGGEQWKNERGERQEERTEGRRNERQGGGR